MRRFAVVAVVVILIGITLVGLVLLPSLLVQVDLAGRPRDDVPPADSARLSNDVRGTVVAALGGAVLLAGAFTAWRQLQHSVADAAEQRRVEREGNVTGRFVQAVEHLSAADTTRRLGGIYALNRIAEESTADREAVANLLAAFVRSVLPLPIDSAAEDVPPLRVRSMEAQAALTVLGRWGPTPNWKDVWPTIDLSNTDLRMANLKDAQLWRARLNGSGLTRATLEGADLRGADLHGCTLSNANLERVLVDARTWLPEGFAVNNPDPH